MVGGFVAVQNRLDFGKETLSCYVEVPDEEQGATELQLLSVRFAPTPPLTASWSAFTSVELLSRVFSLRTQFLVSSASESDFLLPFLNDQQTVTLRFVTPDARALSDLETCLAQHTNDLPCSVQHVTPSAVRGQPVVVSNSRGELSLSQTVRGCKSSVVAMKQEGKKEQEGTLFSSTPLLEPVVVKEDEKVGDSMRKEEVNETPEVTVVKETPEVTVVNETPEVTVVKETQDPPLDPTPLLKESKPWICFVPITHSEAKSPLRRSASIDTLSSLHSTPKKPARTTEAAKPVKPVKSGMSGKVPESEAKEASAQAKSFTPVRQTEKPAEAPVPKAMTKAVATQMAGLSRRKGMSFLSQLLGEEKEAKEVKREVKKEVKKEYRRKWQMPSKPREEEEKEEKEEEKEKREEKETEEKQQKEETEKKKQTTPQLEEPEKVEIEGEKVTLPRKRTTRKPQQKRTAPQAQTAGRKKARVETPPPPIETKPAPEADSDFSSSSEDIDTTQLMDTVKSLLSTPKVRVQSTDSTPSSNGSESEDEDPGLLAMQQMMTGG